MSILLNVHIHKNPTCLFSLFYAVVGALALCFYDEFADFGTAAFY